MICADRQKEESLSMARRIMEEKGVDVVVDFCAYAPGDLRKVMEVLPEGVKQYVFISTCDVYRRGTGEILDETARLETRDFGGEAGTYILGKAALERELWEQGEKKGIHVTSIRSAFIYGPDNYAPREGIFFRWADQAGQVLFPEDADGGFQMVYAKDLARCIYACLLNGKAFGEAFNVCGEWLDYHRFTQALEYAVGRSLERVCLSVRDVQERGIPLPFPLTKEETERYDDQKILTIFDDFTPFREGLRETYAWYCRQ